MHISLGKSPTELCLLCTVPTALEYPAVSLGSFVDKMLSSFCTSVLVASLALVGKAHGKAVFAHYMVSLRYW
jgi:hypothetical protein